MKNLSQKGEYFQKEIEKILEGIDSDDDDFGWWETSTGVEFGKSKLEAINKLIEKYFPNNQVGDAQ